MKKAVYLETLYTLTHLLPSTFLRALLFEETVDAPCTMPHSSELQRSGGMLVGLDPEAVSLF